MPISVIFALSAPFSEASSNDATPGLAQSVSGLPEGQSVVELPEGVFTIGSTWTISKRGIAIHGAGIGKTVLVRDPQFNGLLVKMDAEDGRFSNLTVDGNGTSTAIALHGAGAVIDTVEVRNFTHIGIAVHASNCRVTNCLVTGLGNPAIPSIGIWHDAGPASTVSIITIDHNTIRNNGINGIYCTGGKVIISDNYLSGNHCVVETGGGQIDIGNAFTANTNAAITGNTIVDGGGIKTGGMELGSGSFIVLNNVVRNHGASGIGIGHNVIKGTIANNEISNSGRNVADGHKPQNRSGIYIGYGATNLEISGNRCFDDQPNKSQTWGIILNPPLARLDPRMTPRPTEHVKIQANDLRGNIHPEGLLNQSRARDRIVSGNVPREANR